MYAVVDVETSGFSPAYGARICEIAIVSADSDGEIIDQWSSLVNPVGSTGRSDLHGITQQMVASAPRIEELADEIWSRIAGRVFVAHNAEFDLRFLKTVPSKGQSRDQWLASTLCTRQLAREYLPPGTQRLDACCDFAGIWIEQAHAALGDARATAHLLRYFIQKAGAPAPWQHVLTHAALSPPWRPCGAPQHPPLPRVIVT